jgi:anti-sigma B factor antagonist
MSTARTHRPVTRTTVLAPSGELDLAAVPELRSRLLPAARPGATVVLDLQDVTFMDSSALAVVVTADRLLRTSGGRLQLTHVAAPVLRVLRICGLADRLTGRPAPSVAPVPTAWAVFSSALV